MIRRGTKETESQGGDVTKASDNDVLADCVVSSSFLIAKKASKAQQLQFVRRKKAGNGMH